MKNESERAAPSESVERPKIICLCGSTRFIELFAIKTWELEMEGNIVLGCTLLPQWYCDEQAKGKESRHHFAEALGVKSQRDNHHLRKIDLADEILVLNVGGYVGESTRAEIDYASRTGKPISYLETAKHIAAASQPIAAPKTPPDAGEGAAPNAQAERMACGHLRSELEEQEFLCKYCKHYGSEHVSDGHGCGREGCSCKTWERGELDHVCAGCVRECSRLAPTPRNPEIAAELAEIEGRWIGRGYENCPAGSLQRAMLRDVTTLLALLASRKPEPIDGLPQNQSISVASEESRLRIDEQVLKERDDAEEAISQAYFLITGKSPEWSNFFGYKEALEEIDDAQTVLRKSLTRQVEPEMIAELRDSWDMMSERQVRACLSPNDHCVEMDRGAFYRLRDAVHAILSKATPKEGE